MDIDVIHAVDAARAEAGRERRVNHAVRIEFVAQCRFLGMSVGRDRRIQVSARSKMERRIGRIGVPPVGPQVSMPDA